MIISLKIEFSQLPALFIINLLYVNGRQVVSMIVQ